MCFDRMDWYYEKALEKYFEVQGSCELLLTEEEEEEVTRRAGSHIGFFLTWIIRRGFEGELHQEVPQALEQVREGALLGVDFLQQYCDGKFWDEDLCAEILPFVEEYYGGDQYLRDYTGWVLNDLCDLPLEFVGSWEDYLRFEPLLDRAYQVFLYNKKKRPLLDRAYQKFLKKQKKRP